MNIAVVDELLTTTKAVRRRLDLTRPVARELIEECLALAVHAPNGGNRQDWRFVAIDDAETKGRIAEHYRSAAAARAEAVAAADPVAAARHAGSAVAYLAEHLHQVPVLVLACKAGRPRTDVAGQASFWGSIHPAVWSFMLAARSRGLGTTFTTVHLAHEAEVAEILGVPYQAVTQAALIAVGHVLGDGFRRAERRPPAETFTWNRW